MKVFRFMSLKEFEKYRNGDTLINNTKHQAYTDAVGFCFLDLENYLPQIMYESLLGIVSDEILAVFECEDIFKHGNGTFADPYGSFFATINVEELSITEYSKNNMKLLKYCDNLRRDGEYGYVFDFKPADAPIRRKIKVIDKSTPSRPIKKNTPEQRLIDSIEYVIREHMKIDLPENYFDYFEFVGAEEGFTTENEFGRETLRIAGLRFRR